jgi:hypothetical protein
VVSYLIAGRAVAGRIYQLRGSSLLGTSSTGRSIRAACSQSVERPANDGLGLLKRPAQAGFFIFSAGFTDIFARESSLTDRPSQPEQWNSLCATLPSEHYPE